MLSQSNFLSFISYYILNFNLETRLLCAKLSNTFYLQLVRVNEFAIFIIPSSRSQFQIVACVVVINYYYIYCFCSKFKLGSMIAVTFYNRLKVRESGQFCIVIVNREVSFVIVNQEVMFCNRKSRSQFCNR